MRTICVMNHKGGVGKTTTAINIAAGLSRKDRKVLLVDLDPQGNIDISLKLKADNDIYDALTGSLPVNQCIVNVAKNFDIITSKETLTKAEYHLATSENRLLLKKLLSTITGYDYIIVDCPPSLGLLNQNAMAYCNEAFVPTSTDFLGFHALIKMTDIVDTINDAYDHCIKITKIIPTLHDRRNKICKETLTDIQNNFPAQTSNPIRINSKIKEAPKYGQSIFSYDPKSSGSQDYGQLTEEILHMESWVTEAPITI